VRRAPAARNRVGVEAAQARRAHLLIRTAVYIPNFNGGDMLARTLTLLRLQTRKVRTVVIDNGSSDSSPERVARDFPEVVLVRLLRNFGFGFAINRGVRQYPAARLVFLNNDAEPEPEFIEALEHEIGATTEMVAGVLLQSDNAELIDSAGVVVDQTLLAFDHLHGLPAKEAAAARPPLGPTGGAALVRIDAFEAVGGFDERMFAYLEDVDLALRLYSVGARCRLAAAARCIHQHSSTLGPGSARKNHLMGWSRGYILRRYGVLRRPRRAARALVTELAICSGQVLVDRNAAGVIGRIEGWRAASKLPPRSIPHDALLKLPVRDALARRAQRRAPAVQRLLSARLRAS
jgi:N-acetylglucosaminyl-diphospho-decaprenol L-rhamnosyltransferase